MKKLTMAFIFFLIGEAVFSQTTISFLPVNEYFFTTDQVWNFNIINTGKQSITSSVEVILLKNGSYPVMTTNVQNFEIQKGLNIFSNAKKALAVTSYGNDVNSQSFQNTGILSPGSYAICVTIKNPIYQTIGYSCRELNVTSFTLPVLTYPLNEETIYTSNPILTWLPVLPATLQDLTYKMEIWKTGAGANFKMTGNLYETTLIENVFPYNMGLPILQTGEAYSWNVSAFAGDFYLGSSEIWEFTINSTANAKIGEEDIVDSYRIIDDATENALYVTENLLKIKYMNGANDSLLHYSISMLDNPEAIVDDLPEILLYRGVNKIDIDLVSLGTMLVETYYLLVIEDSNEREYYLRFLYTEL